MHRNVRLLRFREKKNRSEQERLDGSDYDPTIPLFDQFELWIIRARVLQEGKGHDPNKDDWKAAIRILGSLYSINFCSY
jgi:hypothetical protein